jgi:hypothetical protein
MRSEGTSAASATVVTKREGRENGDDADLTLMRPPPAGRLTAAQAHRRFDFRKWR